MQGKADLKRLFLIGIPLLILAIGMKLLDDEGRLLWFEENGVDYSSASFFYFSGEKQRSFRIEPGEEARLIWSWELEEGDLELRVELPGDGERRIFQQPGELLLVSPEGGQLDLVVRGAAARRGSFEVRLHETE
ncbi:MAG TPA: hypothetical protein ENN41_00725 [Sediminispirochaeta sp.]|nr:hypothetical protein [Sediminispirochaeta sp.]